MTKGLPFIVPLLLLASPLTAQVDEGLPRWNFDLQTGIAVPLSDIEGDELGVGFGFGGNFAFRFVDHLSLYAGWDWHLFTPDEFLGGEDLDVEETGYVFGLRFDHPFGGEGGSGPSYRVRAGVTVSHIELEDRDGVIVEDSGHGAGLEIGAGAMFPLGGRWRFGPEVRYRRLGRELDVGEGPVDVDLNYFALNIVFGLRL